MALTSSSAGFNRCLDSGTIENKQELSEDNPLGYAPLIHVSTISLYCT